MGLNIFKKKEVLKPVQVKRPQAGFGVAGRPGALSQRVAALTAQGIPENEIVKELRVEGYNSLDIDRTLRDRLKSGVGEALSPVRERPVRDVVKPAARKEFGEEDIDKTGLRLPEVPRREKPFPTIGFGAPKGGNVEELIEVSVAEKWKGIEETIKGLEGKFVGFDSRIKALEDGMEEMKRHEEMKDVEISEKIDTYKGSMEEISNKMEGMESALKGALESVLESNRTLAEAVRSLKERNR